MWLRIQWPVMRISIRIKGANLRTGHLTARWVPSTCSLSITTPKTEITTAKPIVIASRTSASNRVSHRNSYKNIKNLTCQSIWNRSKCLKLRSSIRSARFRAEEVRVTLENSNSRCGSWKPIDKGSRSKIWTYNAYSMSSLHTPRTATFWEK